MNTKEHELNAEGGARSAELFEVAASSKPALLQARERLAAAELRWDEAEASVAGDPKSLLPADLDDEWEAAWREWSLAKGEVRRLELEALKQLSPEVVS